MPICRDCGLGVPPGFDNCPKCGRPLAAVTATPPPEAPVAGDDYESFYVRAGAAPAATTTQAPAAPFALNETVCSVCGRAPAAELALRRQVGLIFVVRFARLRAPFCRVHGQAAASEYLRRTMVEGWWGIISFFLNFYAIWVDMRSLRVARRLSEPTGRAVEVNLSRPLPEDVTAAVTESAEARAARGSVLRTVFLAIGIGIIGLVVVSIAINRTNDTIARQFGIGLASTLLVYTAVSFLVINQVRQRRIRPHVVEGSPARAVLLGLLGGATAGFAVGGLLSLISGHLSSDKNILFVLFEGDHMQILVITLIAVVAAPFVEEVLFRGLLVESLRSRGRNPAILGGAVAFSLWHLRPGSIEYYILMGFLFGFLYWRLGLAGSISAHAAFNGVLVVLAFLAVGGSSVATTPSGLSVQLPAGWRQVQKAGLFGGAIDLAAESPLGAGLLVVHSDVRPVAGAEFQPQASLPSADSLPPGSSDVRSVTVDGAPALRYKLSVHGDNAILVIVARGVHRYAITLVPGRSERAVLDLDKMLASFKLP